VVSVERSCVSQAVGSITRAPNQHYDRLETEDPLLSDGTKTHVQRSRQDVAVPRRPNAERGTETRKCLGSNLSACPSSVATRRQRSAPFTARRPNQHTATGQQSVKMVVREDLITSAVSRAVER
jgi:hypothetical protein